jgi:hypothetical protein
MPEPGRCVVPKALVHDTLTELGVAGPLKTLVLAHPSLWGEIDQATAGLEMAPEYVADPGLFVSRLESTRADVVLFDADTRWANADFIAFSRSLWPSTPIFAIVQPWSERGDAIRDLVEGLLFKPPRANQWRKVLAKRWGATSWPAP